MEPKALLQLALNMIAVTRLVMGPINIAAATALQAIRDDGREMGVEYGCNVVMPNLSPQRFRKGYQLYDNKPCLDDEPTHCASCLERRIESRGRLVAGICREAPVDSCAASDAPMRCVRSRNSPPKQASHPPAFSLIACKSFGRQTLSRSA